MHDLQEGGTLQPLVFVLRYSILKICGSVGVDLQRRTKKNPSMSFCSCQVFVRSLSKLTCVGCVYTRIVGRYRLVCFWLILLVVVWSFPAWPALARYGALPFPAGRALYFVLAGVDVNYDATAAVWPYPAKPEDFTGRTDTLLLAQVLVDGRVNLLSIPRDTWVNIPRSGWGKINAANVRGGPERLVETVEQLTGLPVDGYVLLSLGAMRDVVSATGGVTLDVPQRMKYDDHAGRLHVDLQPGRQHLSGEQLEGFLRFRYDRRGDIGRIARQQMFFQALAARLKNPWHWWRFPLVVGAMTRHVKTDLTRRQAAAVMWSVLRGVSVKTYTVPGRGDGRGNWRPYHVTLSTMLKKNFVGSVAVAKHRLLSVAVVNVAAPSGSARYVKRRLEALGYQNVRALDGQSLSGLSSLSGSAVWAVRRDLGFGRVSREAGVAGADVTIRLGRDFRR